MQPRRIGNVETAEWRELYQFYLGLERREREPKQLKALAIAAVCLPVVVSMIGLVH
jgi:hypothetical protein